MLVEFSVENFRTFREKQRFTMVTSKASAKESSMPKAADNVIETGFTAAPYVLKQSCVFGANGAGKSTLVEAMHFMSDFVNECLINANRKEIDVSPFGIEEPESKKPSSFEVVFIHGDLLYQYGFAITRERVEEEWLVARSIATQRTRQYFYREYDEESGSYHWQVNSSLIQGEKGHWRTITRPAALFLSTALQFEKSGLEDVFEWIVFHFRFIFMSRGMSPFITAKYFERDGWKQKFLKFFKSIGILLNDIEVTEIDYLESAEYKQFPKAIQEEIRKDDPNGKSYLIDFLRKRADEKVLSLPLQAESYGIRSIFGLAGPILDTLNEGYTVVIDEFNLNLHPLAFREIILMFSNPELNPKNAQLIFTTHDVTVTEYQEVGRDQIWLIEKKPDLTSDLYPLSSFKHRRGKLFRNDYLGGRYGGIPLII